MQHPLQQKVDQIRRMARNVRLLHAVGWLLATALAVGLILGLADFLLRSEELGVRLLFSFASLGAMGWALWRFGRPAIANDSTIVQVAQRIERRWPQLQDRLSSSLEFLAQSSDDATAGSAALRRTVVSEATAQIDGLPLAEVVDRRRPFPVLITVGVLLLVVGLLAVAAPQVAARAARRLVMPWTQNDPWPRRHELAFVDPPAQVPYGEPFRAELIDHNGTPPDLVEIYYWFDGQELADVQPQTMKPTGERMIHQLSRVTRPFKVRASGGDDDTMDWLSVAVVEPPRVETIEITLHPPEYTARKSRETSRHIHAIAGTSVTIHGRANKPLQHARILVETPAGEHEVPLNIRKDQTSFALSATDDNFWMLNESGTYRLLLAGEDGVESGRNDHFQLDIAPDAPPRISVEAPETNTFVTASASVPVRATVSDDIAISRIELRYTRSDISDAGEETIVVYDTPLAASPETDGDSREVNYTWDLSKLENLKPGASLLLSVAAADFRPQEEQSPPRRISIITPDQLEDRIVQRQTFLLGQLAEALAIQREARSQTQGIQIQFTETGELAPKDVVDLQSAELNQRRVDRLLAGEQDGVLAQIDALLEVARQNRLDNPELERRISDLGKAVRQITTNQLPAIGRDLLTGLKAGQTAMHASDDKPVSGAPVEEVQRPVTSAAAGQDRVIEQLEQLLGNLSQWDSYRRFSRQVSGIRRDQQTLTEQTGELRTRTLSKSVQQLSPQERAEIAKLGQRQNELARRMEQMLSQMEQMRGELADDPIASQTLGDAVDLARGQGTSGQMRQTSRQIEENQLGQATQQQTQLGEQLDELLDTLTGRREHQLERRLEKMKEAADELRGLRNQAADLGQQTDDAQANSNEADKRRELQRLEAEREKQQQEIERLARKLERLQAKQAAESLSKAGQNAQRAGEAAAQQAAGQGGEQEEQRESNLAEENLAQAEQQLQEQIQQAEKDLLEEQLARLEQSLNGMVVQQQNINDETTRLDGLRQQNETLSRGQLASVRTLALQQRGLMAEANDFAEQIQAAEVFHLALTGAVREMIAVAERLDATDIGEAAQQAEARALRRLEQLVEAMKEDSSDQPPEDAAGGSSGGSQGEPADGIANIAQLKLLKMMQELLRERTNQLQESQAAGQWTAVQEAEIVALAQEQGQLAQLLLQLSPPPAAANPEDDPDRLPGDALPGLEDGFDQEVQDVLDGFK